MQVSFETHVRRASAEGYTLSKVKVSLGRLEREAREKAVHAAQEGWHGCEMVEPDVVVSSLTATRYCGGFTYWGHDVCPQQFQERRHSRHGASEEADVVGAADWVRTAPIGTEVSIKIDFGNGKSAEVFRRLEDGWGLVHTWDENEVERAEDGPYLYVGIRADVARAIGVEPSSTFHVMFDLAVEQLS